MIILDILVRILISLPVLICIINYKKVIKELRDFWDSLD